MKFYRMKDTAWAQVQCAGASLQIGGRIWGIEPSADWKNWEGWGPYSLVILGPDIQCGMRTIFELRLLRLKVIWKTRGETHPGHYRWDEAGFKIRLLRKHKRANLKKVA